MKKLNEKHAELTKQLVLDSAIELIKTDEVVDLSLKKIAEHAGMSERTLYRHFDNRSVLMKALASQLHQQLDIPPTPPKAEHLVGMPEILYTKLEEKPKIVLAILNSELYQYILGSKAKDRWFSIKALLNESYPDSSEAMREMTAANIRYYLSASTWHYYRYNFKFDIDTSIRCAEIAIEQALKGLAESTHRGDNR